MCELTAVHTAMALEKANHSALMCPHTGARQFLLLITLAFVHDYLQELEKFKFVLDYKIKELKKQIEPREAEIVEMKDQIKEVRQGCCIRWDQQV